jgi:hypothetical protein
MNAPNDLQKIFLQFNGIKSFCDGGNGHRLKEGCRPNIPEFEEWLKNTNAVIAEIFGEESDYYQKFVAIKYSSKLDIVYGDYLATFQKGIDDADKLLSEMMNVVVTNP